MGVELWLDTHCSKCRVAVEELDQAGVEHTVRRYLDDWYAALAARPRVIQRPIITAADGTTVVGRDDASLAQVIAAEC